MTVGRVLYDDHDHVHVLRYVGDIRHPLAPSVSRFVDTLLEQFDGEDVVVDLSEVDTIDSTNAAAHTVATNIFLIDFSLYGANSSLLARGSE